MILLDGKKYKLQEYPYSEFIIQPPQLSFEPYLALFTFLLFAPVQSDRLDHDRHGSTRPLIPFTQFPDECGRRYPNL
jgi:hypothetical protein